MQCIDKVYSPICDIEGFRNFLGAFGRRVEKIKGSLIQKKIFFGHKNLIFHFVTNFLPWSDFKNKIEFLRTFSP